jgi:hypothetical protein
LKRGRGLNFDHTYASAIVGAQKTHARKPADFYPTPPDVTQCLLDFLDLPSNTYIWEPACGDGAMSKVLAEKHNVRSTDLRDDSGFGEGGVDFLQTEGQVDWIITNPPFKLAAAFIEHALSITPNVAMLLKSQFWHARGRITLFEQYPPSFVLPLTWRPAFLEAERGSSPLMDVIWCVWRNGESPTRFIPIRRPMKADRFPRESDPLLTLL